MSKTNNSKAAPSIFTADMLAQNAATAQTKWINFAGTPLCFYKRHVPNAPEGHKRYVHLLRNVAGEAWMLDVGQESDVKGMTMSNDVRILNRDYTVCVATTVGDVAGALIDGAGRITKVVRCADYDLAVEAPAAPVAKVAKK